MEPSMWQILWVSSLVSIAFCQTSFRVFHNTLDPSVFGQNGGAILNANGDGFVDAFTLCLRFQGRKIRCLISPFKKLYVYHISPLLSLQSWVPITLEV